jgi:hypothetical protein
MQSEMYPDKNLRNTSAFSTRRICAEILIHGMTWNMQPKFYADINFHPLHEFCDYQTGFLVQNSGSEYAVRPSREIGRIPLHYSGGLKSLSGL